MTTTTSPLAWPTERGSQEEFAAKYGAERAERFLEAFHAGDPLADALFTTGESTGTVMRQLHAALKAGKAAEGDHAAVVAFVDDLREAVEGVDPEVIEKGRRVYLSISPFVHGAALGPGSLVHTYSSPAISTVLAGTGRLVEGVLRRLNDTVNWTYHLYLPGALTPGEGGFEHTGLVRAMHAYARKQHVEKFEGDLAAYGTPINEIDMLRTWLDFTYVPYQGMANLGWVVTEEQTRDIYAFWQIVGRMLGIPADLLKGLDDHASSAETAEAIDSVAGAPDENSKALVGALIDGMAGQLAQVLQVPKQPMIEKNQAEVHLLHGSELAESLGVPHTSAEVLMALNVPIIQGFYGLLLATPPALEQVIAENEEMLRQLLASEDGQSAYQTAPVSGA